MRNYEPGVFANLSNTEIGRQLWGYLNRPDAISRMETATDLERPALEGVEEQLLEVFGAAVLEDRTKQMIGHMVRQVMERCGYIIAQQNVKITNGAPFSRATRYKKPDAMTFHVHRSTEKPDTYALTADKAGSRLSEHHGSWQYWKSFKGGLRGRIAFGLDDETRAKEDIVQQGFHIYQVGQAFSSG